jgi:CRP-like cAMP-binding protein
VTSQPVADILVHRLESVFPLTDEEKTALTALPMQIATLRSDQDIVREGDRPSRCFLMLEGFVCTYKITARGRRQIMGFYIPGDIPDLQSLHLPVLDATLGTLTQCKVAFIQHEDLRRLCQSYPRLASAFWRETLIDAAIFREWVMNVGRRETYARIAHVFCEMLARMRVVGLAQDNACEFPISQVELADAIGSTPVHVNRTLQKMRADGLIQLFGTRLSIPDWERLKAAGEFDPTYLFLEQRRASA